MEDCAFDTGMQGGRVLFQQGKNSKHVHCPCQVAENVDVRVGEEQVIYDLLYYIANILSCARELDTQVNEAVVGDNGNKHMSGKKGTEIVVDGVSGGGECVLPYEKIRIKVSGHGVEEQ